MMYGEFRVHGINDDDETAGNCQVCPLYMVRGNIPCDHVTPHELHHPYHYGSTSRDIHTVKPMLAWLTLAREHMRNFPEKYQYKEKKS